MKTDTRYPQRLLIICLSQTTRLIPKFLNNSKKSKKVLRTRCSWHMANAVQSYKTIASPCSFHLNNFCCYVDDNN